MSGQHISYSRYTMKVPWKIFVRESELVTTTAVKKEAARLKFQGDEAKFAYEEIVKEIPDRGPTKPTQSKQPKRNKSKTRSISKITAKSSSLKNDSPSKKSTPESSINAILKAIEHKDLQFLIKNVTPDNVNLTDDFGWTPLMSAAYCGHMDIVEFLLNTGANRKIKDKSGYTAAQLALKRNHFNIVALIRRKSENSSAEHSRKSGMPKINIVMNPSMVDKMEASELLENVANNRRDNAKSSTNNGFYCEVCDATFYHASQKGHETSTLHIFNTNPKLPDPMYGIPKKSRGYQMLLHTGWDEQGGLGPEGKGMKYPVRTCLKTDRKGIGQPIVNVARVTHFQPGDIDAIKNPSQAKEKCLKKRDRDKVLSMEARKERALRIALS